MVIIEISAWATFSFETDEVDERGHWSFMAGEGDWVPQFKSIVAAITIKLIP